MIAKLLPAIAAALLAQSAPALAVQEAGQEAGQNPGPASDWDSLKQALKDLEEDRYPIPVEILDYDIPPAQRGDLSTCASDVRGDLFEVYKTCWPVLQSYKQLIRLNVFKQQARRAFEAGAPEAEGYLEQTLALADAMIAEIPGEFPLQTSVGHGAYQNKFELLKIFGQSNPALAEQALETVNAYLASQKRYPMYRGHVTRGYIYKNRTEYLLELGRREEAQRSFDSALSESEYFDKISFDEHAEIVMHDAILAGDEDRALAIFDTYTPRVRRDDDWFDGVTPFLKFYRMYVLAGRGDVDGLLNQINAMDGIWRMNVQCEPVEDAEYYFPLVVHPLETDPRVAAALEEAGCGPDTIAQIGERMSDGINGSDGVRPLPPR